MTLSRALWILALAALVSSCSPYRDLDVGTPFNVDAVTIPANAAIGFPL